MKNFFAPFYELLLKLNSSTSNIPLVTCIISDILMQFTIIAAQELETLIITDDARKLVGWMFQATTIVWWSEEKEKNYQGWLRSTN